MRGLIENSFHFEYRLTKKKESYGGNQMFLEVGLKLQAAVTGDSDDTNMCR
jgi:hypothetical protein